MNQPNTMSEFLNNIITDIKRDIESLINGTNGNAEELTARINVELTTLMNLINMINETCNLDTQPVPPQYQGDPPDDISGGFTPQTLARYNGQNGFPAYVAINGVVYDVTNIPQWAGAVHFSLTPGKDLTPEYSLCHNMREILYKLPTVGIMVFGG
ncbi:MAG: cytochrome b5 domain-containing protein [Eubacteriales bacterium]